LNSRIDESSLVFQRPGGSVKQVPLWQDSYVQTRYVHPPTRLVKQAAPHESNDDNDGTRFGVESWIGYLQSVRAEFWHFDVGPEGLLSPVIVSSSGTPWR
jgi:hypothetical protein